MSARADLPVPARRGRLPASRWPAARWTAVLLLLALAPGCYLTDTVEGRPLPDAAGLAVGRTTKAQALERLGPPLSVRRQFDGDLLIWRRHASQSATLRLVPFLPLYESTSGRSESDLLTLLFDREGLLAGAGTQRDIED